MAIIVYCKYIFIYDISVKVSYSSNTIHQLRKPLIQQHPLTDTLFLYTMLNQGQNPAVVNNSSPSTYCFDVEAVNQFFAEEIHVQEFTRYMRMLIYETTRLHLRYCDTASGELSEEVLQAYDYLNGLS